MVMMRQRGAWFSLIVFLALPWVGLTTPDPGMVWRLAGPHNTVYLAGSIHLLRAEDHPLPPAYDRAFADAGALVLEVDESEMSDPAAARTLMDRAACPEGKSAQDYFSPETGKVIKELYRDGPNPVEALAAYQPWFIAMSLTFAELGRLGVTPAHGAETHFTRKAREKSLPVEALESVDFQVDLLAGLTGEQQDRFLRLTLQDLKSIRSDYAKMIGLWRRGDVEGLDRLLNRQLDLFPELRERLLTARNRNWMKKVKDDFLQRRENVMILVGTAHLIGGEGLVALLEKEGFEVQRVGPPMAPAAP